jgi:hypothetical protein
MTTFVPVPIIDDNPALKEMEREEASDGKAKGACRPRHGRA